MRKAFSLSCIIMGILFAFSAAHSQELEPPPKNPDPLGYIEVTTASASLRQKHKDEPMFNWEEDTDGSLSGNFKISLLLPVDRIAFVASYEKQTFESDIAGLSSPVRIKTNKFSFGVRIHFRNLGRTFR